MIHALIFLPLIFGVLALLKPSSARAAGLVGSFLTLLLGVASFGGFLGGADYAFQTPLLAEAGVYYAVGWDGVGAVLMLAVVVTTFIALLAAHDVPPAMVGLALMMETGLLGLLAAQDLVLFYVFFEATLIPSLLMLGLFGGAGRVRALIKFAIFTLVGSLLMLAGILAVRYLGGAPSFLLSDLLAHPLGGSAGVWAFVAFLLAFMVKTPLFPLHVWLPDFHAENHPSGLADVMGTLYKVGLFGFFRWTLPLFPEAFALFQPYLLALAALTAVGAAWIAYAQTDWKRLLAYGALSHMGIGALGLFSGTSEGAVGAIFLLAASAVYTGGLFLFAGGLYRRFGTMDLRPTSGLAKSAPALAALGLVLVLAMVGLPGLSGFPGEFMNLLGAWQASPTWTFVGFLAVIAAAAYALNAYQQVFHNAPERPAADLDAVEWQWGTLATLVIVFMGVYPKLFTSAILPAAEALAALLGGGR
ncbi:NADH-quinone oxidoreductase subunit M [Oceanithermus sp.]|uniref:complex I subunit 4 family protein n=1 Tax=Oceanithermus sp. TaxID=2268145 RepID=UPI0025F59F4C|nr:NADH-quinone oxidoreductase subunit M [Oceanithermus sp.]